MAFDALKEASNWFQRLSGQGKGNSSYDQFVKDMEDLLNRPYDTISPNKPDSPDYTMMGQDNRTDQELNDLARAQLEEYYQKNLNAIDNANKSENEALNQDKKTAEELLQQRKDEIDSSYQDASSSLNNDLLRRGLARSSIAANTNTKLQQSKTDAINSTQQKHAETMQAIDSKIANLTAQRQQALDQFDIQFAAKVTMQMNELMQERDKANAEAMKFNNSVLQQIQNDYASNLSNAEKEFQLNEQSKEKQLQERQKEFFNTARKVLSTMSAKEAKDKLQNDPIFKNLPQYMHTALFREFVQ
ncbi:MAG: hypothetical protein LBU60_00220 [Clostridiales bacterium]|nr:hypothetical protein [Clostridiales bacterium]